MGLLELLGWSKAARAMGAPPNETKPGNETLRQGGWPQGAAVQLIAGNVVTPLRDQGYSADWFITNKLFALRPEDQPPKAFRASVVNTSGELTAADYARSYMSDIAESYSLPVTFFNREVEGWHMFLWNGVKMNGLQVVTAVPSSVPPEQVEKLWHFAYLSYGNVSKPVLTQAPGLSGWNALDTAWSKLAVPEIKPLWLTSSDAPSRPLDEQPNESGVQLIVAHPAYETGRKALAYFTAPVIVRNQDGRPAHGSEPQRIAALRQSAEQVLALAGLTAKDVGTVMRDSGRGTRDANTRLGDTGAALHEMFPSLQVTQDTMDMSSLLGELGESTVNYSLLMAAFACHERRHPVLYLSSRDPDAARAMLVLPALDYSATDMARRNREANNGKMWNRPWWGERKDGKPDY